MSDYSLERWRARQRHMLIAEEAAEHATKKRRAALAADRRDRLWFLVDHEIEHPIDPREVRY